MPDLTPQQIHRESRWQTTAWAEETNFGAGIFPDVAPHAIPPGGLYDAYDMLCDRRAKIRKRGGTTTLGTTSMTAFATVFGRLAKSAGGVTYYAGAPSASVSTLQVGNTSEGTILISSAAALGANVGRPFEHLGFMIFPSQTPGATGSIISAAGNPSSTSIVFGTPGGVTITTGDPTVTTNAGDTAISSAHVGMMVQISNANFQYVGRVERFIDAHTFTVFPRPTVTITTPTTARLDVFYSGQFGAIGSRAVTGKVGCSHQGRVLLGNVVFTKSGKNSESFPYRVYYSLLPDELPSGNGTFGQHGACYLNGDGYEDNSYFDVPSLEPIVALQPFGEGQVLILGPTKAHRLTGQLFTQTAARAVVGTFDVHPIPDSVGCLSELSVQVTPGGVIWASGEGVYRSDGASTRALMDGSCAETWRDAMSPDVGGLVVGSALVRNHYIVYTNGYAFCCNLATLAWTRLFGAGVTCFYSASDPTSPGKVYGLRYWSGAPPTFAKGCLVRLDSIFSPTSANKADVDGTTVNGIAITKSIAGGDPIGMKNFVRAQFQYACPQANATVDRTVVSPADGTWTSLGTLPAAAARSDYTFGMGLTSVQRGVSCAYRLQTGSCDSFELYAISSAFQPDQAGVSA